MEKLDPISPQEFANKMHDLAMLSTSDPEDAHGKADDLMCDLLRNLGYSGGVEAFERIYKWYA